MKKITALLSGNFVRTHQITDETEYEVQEIDARELLVPERIDLAAKLIYIQAVDTGKGGEFAKEVYKKHIEAFSMGSYAEPGDPNKCSLAQYFAVFDDLIKDIRKIGFNDSKSLIPVGDGNIILDGAHRTACAIYFGKKVKIARFSGFSVKFDYAYFKERRLSEELQNYMAMTYLAYSQQSMYCACFWPIADVGKRKKAVELLLRNGKILVDTEVSLTYQGLRNLMIQIYGHQDWVGTVDNHFAGVLGKVNACYKPGEKTRVILFQGGTLDEILRHKDEIREIFHIGKHAIHISDNMEETRLMSELLLNPNSIQALNLGKPDRWPRFIHEVLAHKEAHNSRWHSCMATASYFGICDYVEVNDITITFSCPRDYFVYMGVKIPSLLTAQNALKASGAANDISADMLKLLRSDDQRQRTIKRKMAYIRTKAIWIMKNTTLWFKQKLAYAANAVGMYTLLHKLHNRLRGETDK